MRGNKCGVNIYVHHHLLLLDVGGWRSATNNAAGRCVTRCEEDREPLVQEGRIYIYVYVHRRKKQQLSVLSGFQIKSTTT